jgi:hypothetical protein
MVQFHPKFEEIGSLSGLPDVSVFVAGRIRQSHVLAKPGAPVEPMPIEPIGPVGRKAPMKGR